MHRSRVLLPLPDLPSNATISPLLRSSEMLSSTGRGLPSGELNAFETQETCRIGVSASRPALGSVSWVVDMDRCGTSTRSEGEMGLSQTVETSPQEPVHKDHEEAHDDDAGQHLGEVIGSVC